MSKIEEKKSLLDCYDETLGEDVEEEEETPFEKYGSLSVERLKIFKFKKGHNEGKSFEEVMKNKKYMRYLLSHMEDIDARSTLYLFINGYVKRILNYSD